MGESIQSLSCTTDSSEVSINDELGNAFFHDITVNLNGYNGTILDTHCNERRETRYTIKCFHADEDMEDASGGSSTLIIIFVCIIFLLCVVVAILFKELRKEKAAHNKTKNDVEEAKTNNNDLIVEYKDEQ